MDNIFSACADVSSARTLYRRLCLSLHPDKGGSQEAFIAMQRDWDLYQLQPQPSVNNINTTIKSSDTSLILYSLSEGKCNRDHPMPDNIRDLIERVTSIAVLNRVTDYSLALIGSWLWLSGTKEAIEPMREQIKLMGFNFSGKHKSWYWSGSPRKAWKGYRSKRNMTDIKSKYGEVRV
jgi:hypothetical protein